MNARTQLVADARQIAQHIGYTHLINGLQPLDDYQVGGKSYKGLRSKFIHEKGEFEQAADFWHKCHEAADLLYYAACISGQSGDESYGETLRGLANILHLPPAMLEQAALAKYNWRANGKSNKDEEYELRLISEALGMKEQ